MRALRDNFVEINARWVIILKFWIESFSIQFKSAAFSLFNDVKLWISSKTHVILNASFINPQITSLNPKIKHFQPQKFQKASRCTIKKDIMVNIVKDCTDRRLMWKLAKFIASWLCVAWYGLRRLILREQFKHLCLIAWYSHLAYITWTFFVILIMVMKWRWNMRNMRKFVSRAEKWQDQKIVILKSPSKN